MKGGRVKNSNQCRVFKPVYTPACIHYHSILFNFVRYVFLRFKKKITFNFFYKLVVVRVNIKDCYSFAFKFQIQLYIG